MAPQQRFCHPAPADVRHLEKRLARRGFQHIAGVDEAGRGPLAGPVVAAAVILPMAAELPGVRDSKQLTATQRDAAFGEISACAAAVSVACATPAEIDAANILQATFQAMLRAIHGLRVCPDFVLVDGPYRLPMAIAQRGVIRGDQRSLSIAAASIVAKVHRDRLMDEQHRLYPAYGFDQHKGYPTPGHLRALRQFGPCPIHRLSFRGVLQDAAGCGHRR
jgi:ribonuclease HII